jgi:hemerythrin-like metal-binding protein
MAVLFAWNDSYNTGIKEIDTQHKKLVDLLNSLYDAMGKGQANQVMGKIFDELVKYTASHFATEERLFKQHGYPEAAAHKREHDTLTAQALALQKDFAAGKTSMTLATANFLKDWLKNHILGSDKKYAPFLIAKGVK